MSEYKTQNSMLLERLKSGRSITMLEAISDYGIAHLPRRILDLKQKGIIIDSEWIKVTKADGRKTRVKEYSYVGEIE
jgi:hypothetical protein